MYCRGYSVPIVFIGFVHAQLHCGASRSSKQIPVPRLLHSLSFNPFGFHTRIVLLKHSQTTRTSGIKNTTHSSCYHLKFVFIDPIIFTMAKLDCPVPDCSETFPRPYYMHKHLRNHHGINVDPGKAGNLKLLGKKQQETFSRWLKENGYEAAELNPRSLYKWQRAESGDEVDDDDDNIVVAPAPRSKQAPVQPKRRSTAGSTASATPPPLPRRKRPIAPAQASSARKAGLGAADSDDENISEPQLEIRPEAKTRKIVGEESEDDDIMDDAVPRILLDVAIDKPDVLAAMEILGPYHNHLMVHEALWRDRDLLYHHNKLVSVRNVAEANPDETDFHTFKARVEQMMHLDGADNDNVLVATNHAGARVAAMSREYIEQEVNGLIDERREQLFGDVAATGDELRGQVNQLQDEIRALEMRKMMLAAEVPAIQTPFQGLPALRPMDTQHPINHEQRAANHSQAGARRGVVDLTATETVLESMGGGTGMTRAKPRAGTSRGGVP